MANIPHRADGRGVRVLLLEDSPTHAMMVEAFLVELGGDGDVYEVLTATTATEAEDVLSGCPPGDEFDVVIVDLNLPDSLGIDTYHRLAKATGAPIVVLSVRADDDIALAALQAGAQDVIRKSEVTSIGLRRALRAAVERARIADELRDTIAERDQALDRLREFTSMATHEVLTPIAAIRGFAELMLLDDEMDPTAVRETLEIIYHQADRGARLMHELLTLARAGANQLQPERRHVAVLDELRLVVDGLPKLRHQPQICCAPDLAVEVDPVHFGAIVANLLVNADRYGAPPVEIGATARPGAVDIRVRDHGPGVPAEEVADIFSAFRRGKGHRSEGSGLGLHVAQLLAASNDGTLTYDAAPGGGAAFTLTLPAPR